MSEELSRDDFINLDIPERLTKYPTYLKESLRGNVLVVCLLCKEACWVSQIAMRRALGVKIYMPCTIRAHKSTIVCADQLTEASHLDIVCDILQKAKDSGEPLEVYNNV